MMAGKTVIPAFRHHRQVILAWGEGMRSLTENGTTPAELRGAAQLLARKKRPWTCATDAATFVSRLRLLGVARHTVARWVDQATPLWTDSSAHS